MDKACACMGLEIGQKTIIEWRGFEGIIEYLNGEDLL